MNNYDHPQDTIDVQHLFQNSPENLSPDPNPAPHQPSENAGTHNQPTVSANNAPRVPRQQNSLDPNHASQQTQAIPQEYSNTTPPSPSRAFQENDINPEDLDEAESNSEEDAAYEKRRKIIIICICAGVLTVLLGLIGLIIFIASSETPEDPGANTETESIDSSNQIRKNVFAGGIELSGKTLEQAKNLLHLKTDHTFSSKSMVVKLPGSTITLSPENTGAKLDVDAVAQAALSCGRDGNESSDGTYNIDLLDYLTLDTEYIKETVETFCKENSSVLTEPVIRLEGTRPNPEELSSEYENQTLVITMGTPEYSLDADDMYNQILDAYSANQMELIYSGPQKIEPDTPDATALYEQYCTPAQDAVLDPATYEITAEIYGYGFDVQELQQEIDGADYGKTISITFDIIKPAILSSDLTKDMFVDTLAEYQNSSNMDDSKRNNNISLSCTALNGYVINAGDTFSFNDAVGKISTKNGYATAPIGKFNGNAMGGGVTQTASALYVCALVANLDIMERHNHEYAVDFCELGLDAFVDGDANDLRFRNNTKSPIRIIAEATGGRIRIEILGVNNLDYDVEIVPKIVNENKPLTTYQNMEPNNALGYADGDIIQSGITGYKVALYMEKYDRTSGNLISSLEVASSEYAKLDEVVARIAPVVTEPTIPDEPTDPTGETTHPDSTTPTDETVPEATEPTAEIPPEATDPTPGSTEPTEETVPGSAEPTEGTTAPEVPTLPELTIPTPELSPPSV